MQASANRFHLRPAQRSGCPISIALDLLGDAWSLLIVRDMMFKGRSTYSEFMDAGEGIATNILAERLRRLKSAGIIESHTDVRDRRRMVYSLTPKGIDLAPMLVELILWSARHENTDAPPRVIERMRRDRETFVARVRRDLDSRRAPQAPVGRAPGRRGR